MIENARYSISYVNLISAVNGSNTASGNIFTDLSRNITINPRINGLSYHDSQLQKLENITAPTLECTSCYTRNTNSFNAD
jgi:hypothetical protein